MFCNFNWHQQLTIQMKNHVCQNSMCCLLYRMCFKAPSSLTLHFVLAGRLTASSGRQRAAGKKHQWDSPNCKTRQSHNEKQSVYKKGLGLTSAGPRPWACTAQEPGGQRDLRRHGPAHLVPRPDWPVPRGPGRTAYAALPRTSHGRRPRHSAASTDPVLLARPAWVTEPAPTA